MKFLSISDKDQGPDYLFYCPGCKTHHGVWTKDRGEKTAKWDFNNDLNSPTVSPSLLIRYPQGDKMKICHSFIRNGYIEFLHDCTHELAGKILPLEHI